MTSAPQRPGRTAAFLTTRWTRVRIAKADSEDGRVALAELCDAYYEPVLAFMQFELGDEDAALEMTHSFFTRMLQGGFIRTADPRQGRFRSYLLGAVKHFLAHERAKERAARRGGGVVPVSLDQSDSTAHAIPDPAQRPADAVYDRQWALTVLAHAMDRLRAECAAEGKTALFERIKPWLTGDAGHGEQAMLAAGCGMGLSALKMSIQRLRQRFRHHLEEEVSGTLNDPGSVQEEMESLVLALAVWKTL